MGSSMTYPQKLSTGSYIRNKMLWAGATTRIFKKHLTPMLRFTSSFRAAVAVRSGRTLMLLGAVYALAASVTIQMQPAQATTIDHYKLYAHSRIIDWNEFMCFKDIITKENRTWDVRAKNGSHFGLGQMRSKWYRNLDGYRQIDATIKYITKRYGTMCKAWSFHQQRNYY
jgi:hypothetical protein